MLGPNTPLAAQVPPEPQPSPSVSALSWVPNATLQLPVPRSGPPAMGATPGNSLQGLSLFPPFPCCFQGSFPPQEGAWGS